MLFFVGLGSTNASNAIDPPSLETLIPPVATRGSDVTIRAVGSSIGHCTEVLFYDPGLECFEIKKIDDDTLELRIHASENCELKPHPIRLRNANGISEIRLLTITPFPVIDEHDSEEPQPIVGNATIYGRLQGDDTDVFVIDAMQGDVISAEIAAIRLGIKMLDSEMTLLGPDAKVVLRVDDTPLLNQDPCFSIRAPVAGKYTIQVSTVGANADANSPYALHLGSFPRPTLMYPLGGAAEQQLTMEWIGAFASDGSPLHQNIVLPKANSATSAIELTTTDKNGVPVSCPTLLPIRAVGFPNAETSSLENPSTLPIAYHGKIDSKGKIGTHFFQIPSDGIYEAEIFATRLGSLLDSVIELRDQTADRSIAIGDDLNSHDSSVTFEGQRDHLYSLSVRDKRLKSGELFIYRAEIRPFEPTLVSFLPRRDKLSQGKQTVSIPRGNRALAIMAVQRDGIESTVKLRWDRMPNHIQTSSVPFEASDFARPVVLEASTESPLGSQLVQPVAITENKQGEFRQTVDLVNGPADAIYTSVTTDRLAISVTEALPYSIELEVPRNPLSVDGTLDLIVKVHREPGFSSPLDLSIPLLPEFVDGPAKTRVQADRSTATIRLRADSRCLPQRWPLVVEANIASGRSESGEAQIGAIDRMPAAAPLTNPSVCSSLRELEIRPSPVSGKLQPIAVECGQEIVLPLKFQIDPDFAGPLTAQLEGLPNRVTAADFSISEDQRSLAFELRVAADAPTGTFPDILVRLSGERMGQHASYCIARKTTLVISPAGKSQKDEAGIPLTPLEALRRQRLKSGS
jgi:hypothetical protein